MKDTSGRRQEEDTCTLDVSKLSTQLREHVSTQGISTREQETREHVK